VRHGRFASRRPPKAAFPLLVLAAIWNAYCLRELKRNEARHLPKFVWGVVIMAQAPFGGLAYLLLGRQRGTAS
jgi:hypothetical protein